MANREWCRHYTGLAYGSECEAGIKYEDVRDTSQRPYRWPCTERCATTCPQFEHWREAEVAETEKIIADFVNKQNAFALGDSRACPECGEPVTGATLYAKYEPDLFSLYVRPCNHRLGLWSKCPDWITDVQIVPVQDDYDDDWGDE